MEMDDELENFIKDQRTKVAEDKANLKKDPPYMEIRVKDHQFYDPTVKENIPPFKRCTAQGKGEIQYLSLPLGEDYERKKQKLQQELRLDYRRYMAQKKRFDVGEPGPSLPNGERRTAKEHLASLRPQVLSDGPRSPRPPSRRDAATLTEGWRGMPRGPLLGGGRIPRVEEDGWPLGEIRTTSRGSVELVSEEDELLELMERRRLQQSGVGTGHVEKRRPRHYHKMDTRERKEADGSIDHGDYQETHHRISSLENKLSRLQVAAWVGERCRLPTNKYETGFATGLMIGAADGAADSRRRKELYRQELQEQIAEQQRNRKREKDLELRVAATGVIDPEKLPDRIKQLGPSGVVKRREGMHQTDLDLAPLPGGSVSRRPGENKPERPVPDQPKVAFQSPLLEYSAALGLGGERLTPYGQAEGYSRGMDTLRVPILAPHPPPSLADAYRTPCDETYLYLGLSQPYRGPMMGVGDRVPPVSYLPVVLPSTRGGLPNQLDPHSYHSVSSSHPEPPLPCLPNSHAADISPGIGAFPAEKVRPSKETVLSYKEDLKQQIQEKRQRQQLEKEERERYEAKLEAHMKNHEPWGRGGGGAPLRDSRGNLMTDLNRMHKLNEEAYINPETWQKRASTNMTVLSEDRPPSSNRVSGFAHVQTPQFARGSVLTTQPTPQQLLEKDKYKSYLKQQIEDKRAKEAEERENLRLEEEKAERRLAEQRARIQREVEEEQESKKRKDMEQKAKNEELTRLAEKRRKDLDRNKKEVEEKENALRKQYERERQTRLEEECRVSSPPIPTHQRKGTAPQHTPRLPNVANRHSPAPMSECRVSSPPIAAHQRKGTAPQHTPRLPNVASRHSPAPMSECSLPGLQSPPVPARRNQLRAAAEDQQGVISELSALRRQLLSVQRRVEGQRLASEWEELDPPLTDRHREHPRVDVFDLARLRRQAPLRRSSRNTEPSNLLRIHDSLQLRYPEVCYSRYGSSELPREGGQSVDFQTQHRMTSLRKTPGHDYFDMLLPRQPSHYVSDTVEDPQTGALLESESAFIDALGDTYPVPPIPEQRTSQLSARERRRLVKRSELHDERAHSQEPLGQADYYSGLTAESLGPRHTRIRGLPVPSSHGQRTVLGELSDDDESPQLFPHGPDHRSSVDTVATEPWMRPESSDTLKRLMTGPSRRESVTGRETNTRDWDVPSACRS